MCVCVCVCVCAHVCACLAGRRLWAQAVGEHSWLHTAIHQSVRPLTAANKYTATPLKPSPPPLHPAPATLSSHPPLTPLLRSTSPAQNSKPHLLIAAFAINLAPVTRLVNGKNEINMCMSHDGRENMLSVYWKYPVFNTCFNFGLFDNRKQSSFIYQAILPLLLYAVII